MRRFWFLFLFSIFLFGCGGGGTSTPPPPPPPPAPEIISIAPNSAILGAAITINGENFGSAPTVMVGGVAATVAAGSTDTEINTTVPPSAKLGAGTVNVSTSAGSASASFTVWGLPTISASPTSQVCVGNHPCPITVTTANVESCAVSEDYGTNNLGIPGDQAADQAGPLPFEFDATKCEFTVPPVPDSLGFNNNTNQTTNQATFVIVGTGMDGKTTAQTSVSIAVMVPPAPTSLTMTPDTIGSSGAWTMTISASHADNDGYGSFFSVNWGGTGAYEGSYWGGNAGGDPSQPPICGAGMSWVDPFDSGVGIEDNNGVPGKYEFTVCNAGISPTDNSAGGNNESPEPGTFYIVASSSNIQAPTTSKTLTLQLVSAGGQKGGKLLIYGHQNLIREVQLPGEISGFAADTRYAYVPDQASTKVFRVNLESQMVDILALPHGLHPTLVAAAPSEADVYIATKEGALLRFHSGTFSVLPIKSHASAIAVWEGMLVLLPKDSSSVELVSGNWIVASYPIGLKADKVEVAGDAIFCGELNSPQVYILRPLSGQIVRATLAKGLWNFASSNGAVYASEDDGGIQAISADGSVSGFGRVSRAALVNGFVPLPPGAVLVPAGKDHARLEVCKIFRQ